MTIWVVHGIHTDPHSRRMLDMCEHIEVGAGIPVEYFEYGNLLAIQTRFCNPEIALRLAALVQPGDALLGHSNGACLAMRALMWGVPAVCFVALNGALKDDIEIPRQLYFAHVYYNKHDGAVSWAERSPKLLTDSLWGDLGKVGYRGKDLRVKQWDCEAGDDGMPDLSGHSKIIDKENSRVWGEYIGRNIKVAMRGIQ